MLWLYRVVASTLCLGLAACGGETSVPDASSGGAHAPLARTCELDGAWNVDIEVPVRWEKTRRVAGGEGVVRLGLATERKVAGPVLIDPFRLRSLVLPTMRLQGGGTATVRMPSATLQAHPASCTPGLTQMTAPEPGGRLRTQPFAVQYGSIIANPTMAPWPAEIEGHLVDVDDDGAPGATAHVEIAGGAPNRVHVAMRYALRSAFGGIQACDDMRALGITPTFEGRLALNVDVVGCHHEHGASCSAAEAADARLLVPVFEGAGKARIAMRRPASR